MVKEVKQDAEKSAKDKPVEIGPCMEAQSDGAPCDCAQSDCRTCGKGVPVEKK